jgi:AAA15 family ATPase/GTPase
MQLTFPTKELLVKKAYQEQLSDVSLLIANHRSLADWSLVPLSKISLVLGPNSAGKSSIYETFDILSMFTRMSASSPELELVRDATRSSEVAPAYGLSAKYPAELKEVWEYLSQVEERLDKKIRSPNGEISLLVDAAGRGSFPIFGSIFSDKKFQNHLSETVYTVIFENLSSRGLSIEVYLDGVLAGTWVADEGHQEIKIKNFVKKFLLPKSQELINIFTPDDDFKYNYYYAEWSKHAPEMGPAWPSFGTPANFLYQLSTNESNDPGLADEVFALITAVFHYPLTNLIRKHAWTFSSEPIRDLDSDWFFCELSSDSNKKENASPQFKEGSNRKRASGKQILAREAIFEIIAKAKNPELPESEVLLAINNWIGGKAYLDSGYQIKVGLKICLPIKEVTSSSGGLFDLNKKFDISTEQNSGTKSSWFGIMQLDPNIEFLARIYLVDQSGRELRFSEVGTGFSQILPILIHLGISNNYVIRQPEVHLHPRLQSRIADCIISNIARDRNKKFSRSIVVETHSEHIVLRLLRRIRDSFKDPLLHSSLTLYPNELSLIYVKPEPDRSRIFLIRVNESGDFIDGWPDGFFDDRDEDLWG